MNRRTAVNATLVAEKIYPDVGKVRVQIGILDHDVFQSRNFKTIWLDYYQAAAERGIILRLDDQIIPRHPSPRMLDGIEKFRLAQARNP